MTENYSPPREDIALTKDVFRDGNRGNIWRRCATCGSTTTIESKVASGESFTEYDNVLIMELFGGYGMFFDDFDSGNYTLVICHDCAHEACDRLPWLSRLLKPANSHSHTQAYMEANPNHYGHDYDED